MSPPRRAWFSAGMVGIVLLLAVVVFADIGSEGSPGKPGDPSGRNGVSADQWAAQVCSALSPWRSEITNLTAQAQRQLDASTGAEQAKAGLVGLLQGGEAASEQARAKVSAAGVPDVANGREVARAFLRSLVRTRDAYATARVTVVGLPTVDPAAFYSHVSDAFDRLRSDYDSGAVDPRRISSAALKRAFDTAPACS